MGYPPGAQNDSRAPYNEKVYREAYEPEYDKYDDIQLTPEEEDDGEADEDAIHSVATTFVTIAVVLLFASGVGLFILLKQWL